jgi:aerobic carbon-monoxide dehydrogenase medium subunit
MYAFNYKKASSVSEAKALFSGGDDPLLMAGGQTLIPTLKQRLASPSDVIDIGRLEELRGISVSGDSVTIGAGETHASVANSADVAKAIPALAALAGKIGDPAVRHRGTLGGSVANADPTADYPAALLALGATVHTEKREISAADFFTDLFETALEEGEIITKVSFPVADKAGYVKFPNPASRYAIVGVFVAQVGDDVRVAVTGAGSKVFRVGAMEDALKANFSADAIADGAVDAADLNSDLHASADYRAHLIGVMARRAVVACG